MPRRELRRGKLHVAVGAFVGGIEELTGVLLTRESGLTSDVVTDAPRGVDADAVHESVAGAGADVASADDVVHAVDRATRGEQVLELGDLGLGDAGAE